MASLASLPNELLDEVCNAIYPRDGRFEDPTGRLECLSALAALARTSHRLQSIAEPVLYHRGLSATGRGRSPGQPRVGMEAP
jgi:hypothetical protein